MTKLQIQLFVGMVKAGHDTRDGRWSQTLRVDGKTIAFKLDTGSDVNIISELEYQTIDLFRGACAVKGNVQVAGHVKPAPFSRRDVTLGDVDGSLFHITI